MWSELNSEMEAITEIQMLGLGFDPNPDLERHTLFFSFFHGDSLLLVVGGALEDSVSIVRSVCTWVQSHL